MSIVRCPHCGTANRAGSNFCNGCGTDLRDPGATAPSESAPSPPERSAPAPGPAQPSPAATSPARPPTDLGDQPWLRLEFTAEDDESAARENDDFADRAPAQADDAQWDDLDDDETTVETRLVTGIQGLLAPIRIATNIADDAPVRAGHQSPPVVTPDVTPDAAELRMIRGLMAEPPTLVNYQVHAPARRARTLHIPWIFVLVGLAVGLPALLGLAGPQGQPFRWPGVEEAYVGIQDLTPNAFVVVYWAYDPATAGELDLVMQPVLRHLLQRRARLAVVSPLPGGVASAQRLIAQLRVAQGTGNLALAADLGQPITFTYLPGGASVLPLVARAPAQALLENPATAGADQRTRVADAPALVVAVAAQAEDVQHWLEQVQPLERTPVIAVTGAAADPILRPYLDSRQLRGLVSGFDGAATYQRLLDPFAAPESTPALLRQIVLQNWGHLALLAAIVLGNLAALLSRENGA
jgi:hypothetical protein